LRKKEPNSLPPERFLISKYTKNALTAGAPPNAAGELTVLPDPLAGFSGGMMGKGNRGGRTERREGRGENTY